jgi:hypothetical protein
MIDAVRELFKQPFWVIALVLGVFLIAFPCVTIDKDFHWSPHSPSTVLPVVAGATTVLLATALFAFTLWKRFNQEALVVGGVDLARVSEIGDVLSTVVSGCELRVLEGRIEEYAVEPGEVIVLPCNEYFDDECAGDTRSVLGAYVNRAFEGRVDQFVALVRAECQRRFGAGIRLEKTANDLAESFGPGKCILLTKPLGRSTPVALVSTTTQRANQGLAARISYMFDGMKELISALADARLGEVVMPVMGAGHGRIDAPLAFVGLLLAVAEAARYGQGGQRLTRATIVVFRRDSSTPGQVDKILIRRALALVSSGG